MTAQEWSWFRRYWFGYFVSTLGDAFTLVALPVAAFSLGRSSLLVGVVDMMEVLAGVVLGWAMGVAADRSESRRVLWTTDAVRAALLALLALLAVTGGSNAATLVAAAFALGLLRAFHDGAESTMLALVLRPDAQMKAWARLGAAESAARLIGPVLAGLALQAGLWATFGVDAVTFAIAAIAVLTIPRPSRSDVKERSAPVRVDLGDALRAMAARPQYLRLVANGALGNLAGLTLAGLFVPYATEVIGIRAAGVGFGALLAMLGIGGLVADVVASRHATPRVRSARIGMAAVAGTVTVAGLAPSRGTAAAALAVTGAGMSYFQANYSAFRQCEFDPALLGRVAMLTRTVFYATMIVGLLVGGLLGDALGPDRMFAVLGATSFAGIVGCELVGRRLVGRQRVNGQRVGPPANECTPHPTSAAR